LPRFRLLAVDYDGTLATHGKVNDATVAALKDLKDSGRKLVLVTGRTRADLQAHFARVDLFDRVVAENGATLFDPASDAEHPLAEPPPRALVAALEARKIPLGTGQVIVATVQPHEQEVLEVIRDLGLELQVIFNKGAVMVLPANVNKASGLHAALAELRISEHNAVGIGDAENDYAFLRGCECSVAVANALRSIKRAADFVTAGGHGEGVAELCAMLVQDDLATLAPRLKRHRIVLGEDAGSGKPVAMEPFGTRLLVSGSSKAGKSSLVLGLVEQVRARGYQYCLIDPEGDYERLPDTVTLGDEEQPPTPEQVLEVLRDPFQNVCVSLLAVPGEHRPGYFSRLISTLDVLCADNARPHWLIVDEAHHVLPRDAPDPPALGAFGSLVLVTLEPHRIASTALAGVNFVLALGKAPRSTFAMAAELLGAGRAPAAAAGDLRKGDGALWHVGKKRAHLVELVRSSIKRRRHRRKYTEAELPPEKSFFFRGPQAALNLRASNLYEFVSLAEGVDDETWLHHLRAGDYSNWIEFSLKDRKLARSIAQIARHADDAKQTRAEVRKIIEARYAPPA
jgi:hydroxymethylpyrimidine pyrophosphatase-like HAD family hydrolase